MLFDQLRLIDESDYLISAGTWGESDEYENECGITTGHAFSVIAVFTLENDSGGWETQDMLMIRNPWGDTYYSEEWNYEDERWTDDLVSQVPLGIDPRTSVDDGIFIVPKELLIDGYCL